MEKETLLEKAKKVKITRGTRSERKVSTEEGIETAFAWIKDEIGLTQISKGLGYSKDSGNVLYYIAIWLREAYRQGKLKIKK